MEVVPKRVLNRTLLERQYLLRRTERSVGDALEDLVGLQAQSPIAPYVGLWSRLDRFDPEDLSQLIEKRKAVRIALMRSTIHLVTARDALMLRPIMQRPVEKPFGPPRARALANLDRAKFLAYGRKLLEEEPRTHAEVGPLLEERFQGYDADAMAMALRVWLPLVQVPPRGLWRKSGRAAHTTAESWLGRPMMKTTAPNRVITRYLRAFGPASVQDMQTWSGLTGLREVVEKIGSGLRSYRDEQGAKLFDVTDGRLADPEMPAPIRFLPEYDNTLMGHADRSRVIDQGHRMRIFTRGALLIDGFARGMWTIKKGAKDRALLIEVFGRVAKRDRTAIDDEGARLVEFVTAGTGSPVRFTRF